MSLYMKRFVFAALFYLASAAVLGMVNGIFEITYWGVFAHTHFSLLGFMAMIVFGIGYFILPRFNGTDLMYPRWVPVHFWLANFSLVGLVIFRGLSVETGDDLYEVLFILSAALQAVSLLMFVVNIWLTLTPSSGSQPETARKSGPAEARPSALAVSRGAEEPPTADRSGVLSVTAQTRIAELVDAAPPVMDVLVSAGLSSLRIPGHLNQVRAMGLTVGMAADRHGIDRDRLIAEIERELGQQGHLGPAATDQTALQTRNAGPALSADVLIGSVISDYPETREVFQKYFGSGCFECPGQAYESIDMACRMHGVDQQAFLQELNGALKP